MALQLKFLELCCWIFVIGCLSATNVSAQNSGGILPDVTYGGEFVERPSLSGDWDGLRDSWSQQGIQFDHSLTQVAGFVLDGGINGPVVSRFFDNDEEATHASWDNVLQIDTGKLGLWPGGLFKIRGEGRVGKGVNGSAGAISPVDTDMLFPLSDYGDAIYDLTEATFTQFLSEYVGVVGGILNTLDGDALSFAGSSRGTSQFFNESFVLNPVETKVAPYKTLGGGLIVLPTKDPSELLITGLIMDTEDSSGHNPFSTDSGTSYATEVNVGSNFFDLPGKHVVGYMYGDDNFNSLDDPRVILPGVVSSTKGRSYAAYYSFEQYVHVESESNGETKGIGFFGRFGFSDGNPNPVEFAYSFGVGGNAPWRLEDTFGAGFYYLDLSDDALLDVLQVTDEKGFEVYYNIGITPWLHVTPDLQIVAPGLPGTDTAYILGLRTHVVL